MKHFKVVKLTDDKLSFSMDKFCRKVEKHLAQLSAEGYDIISVSFTQNYWKVATAMITVSMDIK